MAESSKKSRLTICPGAFAPAQLKFATMHRAKPLQSLGSVLSLVKRSRVQLILTWALPAVSWAKRFASESVTSRRQLQINADVAEQ
jgi:hypothetical protein